MTESNGMGSEALIQAVFTDDPGFLRRLVEQTLQQVLEAEMTAHLGATRYERTESRTGQRNGYKPRQLQTRVGALTLRVPQDRAGTFSTQLFARYQRTEKALVLSLMEMYLLRDYVLSLALQPDPVGDVVTEERARADVASHHQKRFVLCLAHKGVFHDTEAGTPQGGAEVPEATARGGCCDG